MMRVKLESRRWLHGQGKAVRDMDILRVLFNNGLDQVRKQTNKQKTKQTRIGLIRGNRN